MADENKQLKKHVHAAKEWLGKAEQSLDNDERLKGDLNVMLAKAELQRASETEAGPGARGWGRRLLPAAVAAVLAAVCWQVMKPAPVQIAPVTVPPAAVVTKKEPLKPELKQEKPAEPEKLPEEAAEPVPVSGPAEEKPQQAEIPSADMQKLMCTAGQSLRAQ